MNLQFNNKSHAAFPFPACRVKGILKLTAKWLATRGVWPWHIQIEPFAVYETYLCKINLHFVNNLHAAFLFPACREKGTLKVTAELTSNKERNSNWAICSPWNLFLKSNFPLLTSHMQHFPFPACRVKWKGTPWGSKKLTAKVTSNKSVWPWGISIGPFAVHEFAALHKRSTWGPQYFFLRKALLPTFSVSQRWNCPNRAHYQSVLCPFRRYIILIVSSIR